LIFSVQTPLSKIDEYIKPGEQIATLVLSDGVILKIQKEDVQMKIEEGKAEIINRNNTLSYNSVDSIVFSQATIYNELITPRGGSYNITLVDGTKVWLNAASKLKFPVVFTDSIRQIYLEGEAFFDVAHNGKPFIVNSGDIDIEVLGTAFNISAYSDDNDIKTTLVDGSIKLRTPEIHKTLLPSEQAIVSKENFEINIRTVNTTRYTSWVNGKIEFNNESLDVVMKRLSRWYDFSYSFKNKQAKNFHFSARIENSQNISSILEMLQKTTDVKLEIEKKTIVIL
jgi:ferric-dicitrate binding protein FerR (iron transport regulator)